jgi:hypothetical protein
MNVVMHDHLTTNGDVEGFFGALGEKNESSMDLILCKKPLSLVGAKSDEIRETRVKEAAETWRAASEILLHEEVGSHGPAGRPMQNS